MKYLIFFVLSVLGYVVTILMCSKIATLRRDCVEIKYSSMEFSDMEKRPLGLNILIRVLFPVIYVTILSGIFYECNLNQFVEDVYLISVFYYIVRIVYLTIILGRGELQDWRAEIIVAGIGILLTWSLYEVFLTKTEDIFISMESLRDGIWTAFIIFIFVVIREYIYNYTYIDMEKEKIIKEKYIAKKYEKFRNKYGEIINEKDEEISNLVYAIMINEDFNRPSIIRMLENIKVLLGKEATLGIMQVKSKVIINNKTSVKNGYKLIKKYYKKNKKQEGNCLYESAISQTIFDYNCSYDYVNSVQVIYDEIMSQYGDKQSNR